MSVVVDNACTQIWDALDGGVKVTSLRVSPVVYDAVASFIILKVLDLVMGLRVPVDIEREGLDLALHGEVVQ